MAVVIRPFIFGVLMTVSISERLSPLYEGNGTNTRFDFTFRVFDQEDASGVSVKHQVNADFENVDEALYSVVINEDNLGGYITFYTAPAVGFEFYIMGETPVDQLLDITNYDNFYPDAIERSLDKLTAILQEWVNSLGFEKLSRGKALELLDLAIQEQIREQGLAMDQIDSYAKALSDSIRNIVIQNGWLAELVVDGSTSQKEINAGLDDISQLLLVQEPNHGMRMYVKSYVSGLEKGGGQFIYDVNKTGTNDGGTVCSGWVRQLNDYIDFDMFGIEANGSIPVDQKIINAFAASKLYQKPLRNYSGTYYLDGADPITIGFDYDLTGTVFKFGPNFSGGFIIDRGAETIIYDSLSDIVALLKTQGILSANATSIPVLANDTTIDDSYISISTSTPLYRYRGDIMNRFELNRVYKKGQVASTFYYDFDMTAITQVKAQKVADTEFTGKGLSIDETLLTANITIVRVRNGNRYRLSGFRFNDDGVLATNIKSKVGVETTCHDWEIDGLDTSSVYINSANDSNYTIWAGENFGVKLKNICSDGYGWGAIGFNNCKRVTFEDSQLNRIDFHKPCHDYLKIKDCTIGNWGILVTMMGDLILENPYFLMRKAYQNDGILRSRDDTGGWCNGNLIITNPIIDGELNAEIAFARCQRADATNAIPSGSPIRPEFFSTFEINGGVVKSNVLMALFDSNQSAANAAIKLPRYIKIDSLKFNFNDFLTIYLDRFAKRNEGVILEMNDTPMGTLNILDNAAVGTKVFANIEKLRGFDNSPATFVNKADGVFNVSNSKLLKYSEYSGGYSSFTPVVNFIGGELENTTNSLYLDVQNPAKDRISARGMKFTFSDANAFRDDLQFMNSANCRFNSKKYFDFYVGSGALNTTSFQLKAYGDLGLIVKSGAAGALKTDNIIIDISQNGTAALPSSGGTVSVSVASNTATVTVNATSLQYVGMTSN